MAKTYDHLFKFLLIGDVDTGWYDQNYTIGVDFKTRTMDINEERVKLQLWDTATQERFPTITSAYYRGAHGVFVVYNVNCRKSFDNLEERLHQIDQYCTGVNRILVGNDDDDPATKVVPTEEAQQFADRMQIQLFETSTKHNRNVDEVLMALTTLALHTKKEKKQQLDAETPAGDGGNTISLGSSGNRPAVKNKCY